MEFIEILKEIKVPVTIIHVVSVVIGMGAALMSDVLFSFFSKDKKLNKTEIFTLEILSKVVFYTLFIICISGILIFLTDIGKYSNSTKFLSKMSILFLLILNGYVLNTYIWPHLLGKKFFILKKEKSVRRLAFVCGSISIISWLSVLGLGVLDSLAINYLTLMGTYLLAITLGSIVSLVVEKFEFE